MKRSATVFLLACLAAVVLSAAPRLVSVEPTAASPGDELTAAGSDIGAIDKLFLTVGSTDIEVEMLGRTDDGVSFKVPADTASGMYRLMIQTGGDAPALLVQPVMCEVMTSDELAQRKAEEEAEQKRFEEEAAAAAAAAEEK